MGIETLKSVIQLIKSVFFLNKFNEFHRKMPTPFLRFWVHSKEQVVKSSIAYVATSKFFTEKIIAFGKFKFLIFERFLKFFSRTTLPNLGFSTQLKLQVH